MTCDHCTKAECSKRKGVTPGAAGEQAGSAGEQGVEEKEPGRGECGGEERTQALVVSDCLACGGCLSAGERVLMAQQNPKQLMDVLRPPEGERRVREVVASVSPESLAWLAARYGMDTAETARRLTGFLHGLGVHRVLDVSVARDVALAECQREFVQRFRHEPARLPLLTSSCPGWVRFVERLHGEAVAPYLSRVRSAQQVMGALLKERFAQRQGVGPEELFHVTVMPCYDRKLEATRPEFRHATAETPHVDCVLTTGELVSMLDAEGKSLAEVEPGALDTLFGEEGAEGPAHERLWGPGRPGGPDGAVGCYLEAVLRHAAHELFGVDVREVTYSTLRNKDMWEARVERHGEVLLRFAGACGLRNVQNVVAKLRRGRLPYHFVEISACPSGCLNGPGQPGAQAGGQPGAQPGGQPGGPPGGQAGGGNLATAQEAYRAATPRDPPDLREVASDWLGEADSERALRELVTTTFQTRATGDVAQGHQW